MRPVTHGDVAAAARLLFREPEAGRARVLERLICQAESADHYRREFGRVHPFWGNGSLMAAALAKSPPPEPDLDDPGYCSCLVLVFEALVNRARRTRMLGRSGPAAAA